MTYRVEYSDEDLMDVIDADDDAGAWKIAVALEENPSLNPLAVNAFDI